VLVGDGWAFVHIPKCGGTTVRSVLRGVEVSDILPMADEATVSHPCHWVSYAQQRERVFCFVRHPAHWLRSYWTMRASESRRNPKMVLDQLWSDDMDTWILRVCHERPGYVGRLFTAYAAHCSEVYKLEDGLDSVLASITVVKKQVVPRNYQKKIPISASAHHAVKVSERVIMQKYCYT
jgi:hypothetical protein